MRKRSLHYDSEYFEENTIKKVLYLLYLFPEGLLVHDFILLLKKLGYLAYELYRELLRRIIIVVEKGRVFPAYNKIMIKKIQNTRLDDFFKYEIGKRENCEVCIEKPLMVL